MSRFNEIVGVLRATFVAAAVVCPTPALSLVPFDDDYQTPAVFALNFKKAPDSWMNMKLGYFDGLITNNQTDTKHYDRRIGTGIGIGFELPTAPNLSFRLDLRAESILRRQVDNATPETYIDEHSVYARPTADLTYITPAGLELIGGASMALWPTYSQKVDSSSDSTSIRYSSVYVLSPHIAITRRGGVGAGGLYYQFGKNESRNVTKSASDGTQLEVVQTVQEPSMLGVYAMFNGGNAVWTADLASVSEGDGAERTVNGSAMRDDYLRLSLASTWNKNFKIGLNYRSASYAKSTYMDLDSIPISALKISWLWGAGAYSGVMAAYGRDKQSIPEMNARYQVNALSFTSGVASVF